MKPNRAEEKPHKRTSAYSSWLGPFPLLGVFLGRRSAATVSQIRRVRRQQGQLTLVDVGQDTALGDGDVAEQLVQFLIVADGELQVTRDDTRLLVVTGSVASQLEDFSGQVFEHRSQVHGSTGTDTLGVVTLAKQTVDTADGECETSLGRAAATVSQNKSTWKTKG